MPRPAGGCSYNRCSNPGRLTPPFIRNPSSVTCKTYIFFNYYSMLYSALPVSRHWPPGSCFISWRSSISKTTFFVPFTVGCHSSISLANRMRFQRIVLIDFCCRLSLIVSPLPPILFLLFAVSSSLGCFATSFLGLRFRRRPLFFCGSLLDSSHYGHPA